MTESKKFLFPHDTQLADSYARVLNLPVQLQQEDIDLFINFDYYHNYLVIENDACRKRMNKYRSIAQRLKSKGIQTEDQIDGDFFDVVDILNEEILPNWKLKDFITFFYTTVKFIVNKRQLDGRRLQLESWLREKSCKSNTGRWTQRPETKSVKQQVRTNKDYLLK